MHWIDRALPSQYDSFVTSLIMSASDNYTVDDLAVAFQAEESQRQARQASPGIVLANATTTTQIICDFCGYAGNSERDCRKRQEASEKVQAEIKARKNKKSKKQSKEKWKVRHPQNQNQ